MRGAAMLLLGLAAVNCALPVHADQLWTTAGDETLANMRGGFALPDGLLVSFGIVRTVLVDGQVVGQTSLNIPDLRAVTTEQAQQLGQQASALALVQSGPGNSVQPAQAATLSGIVIQNTLNNRQLQAITEITATTNSLRLLQGMNLNQVLNDALKAAVGR